MTLVDRLAKGTRFYPAGSNAVVDARDVAGAMVRLMEHGASGERYILAGENLGYKRGAVRAPGQGLRQTGAFVSVAYLGPAAGLAR